MALPQRIGVNPPTVVPGGETIFRILSPAPGGCRWGAKPKPNVLRRVGGGGVEVVLRD